MMKRLAFLLCLTAQVSAATWQPSDRFLHAVRFVESSHGIFTRGDNGQSLGDYQISEAAWMDVSSWRKAHALPAFEYARHVWDKRVSREYAANYFAILHTRLEKHLNRPPTAAELYAAYNMGMTSFGQCRYQLTHVNPMTARKCQQINALMAVE
jgi:hypothetical protein